PVAVDLDADDLLLDTLVTDPRERLARDEVGVAVEIDEPIQPELEGVVFVRHVGAPVEDASLDPADVHGTGRPNLVRAACLHDPLPEVVSARRVEEVDLVADLRRPARAGEDELDAVEVETAEVVVAEIEDVVAEQVAHDVLRLRSLNLKGI